MVIHRGKLLLCVTIQLLFVITLCDVSHLKSNNQQQQDGNHYHSHEGNNDNDHEGIGWDIRLSVPGEPERDYPVLNSIPPTSFNCIEKKSGYYADIQTRCQVFRVCAPTAPNGYFSFLCPNGTLFNQEFLVCDWWMNVKCVDTERYMNKNDYVMVKSGSEMMSDIEKMITYPMTNPYKTVLSNTKTVDQKYNPPSDMFEFMQQGIQNDMAILDSFKLPGPNAELSQNNVNKDSYTSGTSFLGHNPVSKKYEGAVPDLPNNVIYGNNIPESFTTTNFGGLSIQNQLNSNTKSIKITKQQFTYPSQYDKEYTLTVPRIDPSPQQALRVPINIPATNTNSVSEKRTNQVTDHQSFNQYKSFLNNESTSYLHNNVQLPALTNIPKALPLIVLFLQPPLESISRHSHLNQLKAEFKSGQSSNHESSLDTSSTINQSNNQDTLTLTKNRKAFPNNGFPFTTNLASQTNYYITNNFSKPKAMQPTIDPDVETVNTKIIHSEPARLTLENTSTNNIAINAMKNLITNTTTIENILSLKLNSENQLNDNSTKKIERDNGLVTLFSAHIIPAGDVNKQKVLRVCIPKDILSYLVHLHNSTKSALFKAYQNEINSFNNFSNNTSIHIQGQPLIKRIMENLILKNQSYNQQVPSVSEENFYNQQQNPDGYFRSGHKNTASYQNNFVQKTSGENLSQYNANYNSQVKFSNEPVQKIEQTIYSTSASFDGSLNKNLNSQLSHYEENSKININNHQNSQTKQKTTLNEVKNTSRINSQYNNNVISASQVVSLPNDESVKTENKLFYVNQQSTKFLPSPNVNGQFYSAYQQVYKQTPVTDVHEKIINKEFVASDVKNGRLQNVENKFSVNSTQNFNQVKHEGNYNFSSNLGHRNSSFNFQTQRFGTDSDRVQSMIQSNKKSIENQNNFVGNIVYADKQHNYNSGQSANFQTKLSNQNSYKSTESSPNTSREISHYIYTQYTQATAPNENLKSESEQKINSNVKNDVVKTVISSKYTNQNANNNMQYSNNFNTGSANSNYNGGYQPTFINNPTVETAQYSFQEKNKHSNQINKLNNNNYNTTNISGGVTLQSSIQHTASFNSNKFHQNSQAATEKSVTQNNMYYNANKNVVNNNSQYRRPQNDFNAKIQYQNPKPISPSDLPPHLLINFEQLNQNNNGYVNSGSVQEQNKNDESIYQQRQQNINTVNQQVVQYPVKSDRYQIMDYTQMDNEKKVNTNGYIIRNNDNQNENVQKNINTQHPGTATVYTTVEVIPALGFSLNTEPERQHYYSVMAGGHKSNYKEANTPYMEQQIVMYPQDTQEISQMQNSQLNDYNRANYAQQQQTSFVRSNHYNNHDTYNSQNRNVHGHVISHVTSQPTNHDNQRQSLPIEDFGYPREKPSVSFMF